MKVAVTWEMCGYVDVPGNNMEEAMEYFDKNSDYIRLPSNGEYVEGSFCLSTDDVDAMEAMCHNEKVIH